MQSVYKPHQDISLVRFVKIQICFLHHFFPPQELLKSALRTSRDSSARAHLDALSMSVSFFLIIFFTICHLHFHLKKFWIAFCFVATSGEISETESSSSSRQTLIDQSLCQEYKKLPKKKLWHCQHFVWPGIDYVGRAAERSTAVQNF